MRALKMWDLAKKNGGLAPLNSAKHIHLMSEISKRVFADRAEYLGDPDFVDIPKEWQNEKLNFKWNKIKKIRDEVYISIESQRANKIIGSSLEANINIKLKEEIFNIVKDQDFSEICITSAANITQDNKIKNDIEVITEKAKGNKCPVCWKISETSCEKHGHLTNK